MRRSLWERMRRCDTRDGRLLRSGGSGGSGSEEITIPPGVDALIERAEGHVVLLGRAGDREGDQAHGAVRVHLIDDRRNGDARTVVEHVLTDPSGPRSCRFSPLPAIT